MPSAFGRFVLARLEQVGGSISSLAKAVGRAYSHTHRVIQGYPALPFEDWPAWESALALDDADRQRFRDLAAIQHLPEEVQAEALAKLYQPARLAESVVPYVAETATSSRTLHLVARAAAGDGRVEVLTESRPIPLPNTWACVQIHGDSAYPVVYAGQLAIVDLSRATNAEGLDAETLDDLDDNLVLVHTTDDRYLLKRLSKQPRAPDGFVLSSVNSGLGSPYVARSEIAEMIPVVGVIYEDPTLPRQKGRIRRPSSFRGQ